MNLKQIYHEYDCLNSPYQVGATCTPEELHSIIMEEIETIGASNPHWNKLNEIESDLRKRRYETMNVSKHTPISLPLPLQAILFDDGWIRDADNHRVCMIDELEIREFIVRACNAHDELVAFIEHVAEWNWNGAPILNIQQEAFELLKKIRNIGE